MKTIEQVREEKDYGDVMTSEEFVDAVDEGYFIPYDGDGYVHDGEKELHDKSVWNMNKREILKYPYVRWYNK